MFDKDDEDDNDTDVAQLKTPRKTGASLTEPAAWTPSSCFSASSVPHFDHGDRSAAMAKLRLFGVATNKTPFVRGLLSIFSLVDSVRYGQ